MSFAQSESPLLLPARNTMARRAMSTRLLWAPVVVACLIRVAALLVSPHELTDDARDYHEMAGLLSSGTAFTPEWPPGLPLYLAAGRLVFGPSEAAARWLMLPWFAAFMLLTAAVACCLAGERAVLILLSLFAVYPTLVTQASVPLTNIPAAALLAGVTLLLIRAVRKDDAVGGLGLGATLAALVLVRPSALSVCLAAPAWLLYARRPRTACASLIVCAALVGAWIGWTHKLTGRWILINTANAQNVFYGNNPSTPLYRTWWFGSHKSPDRTVPAAFTQRHREIVAAPASKQQRMFLGDAATHVIERPDLFVIRTASRLRTLFVADVHAATQAALAGRSSVAMVLLVADLLCFTALFAGALLYLSDWRSRTPQQRAGIVAIAVAAGAYSIPYCVTFSHPVYRLPVVPLLAAVAAAGFHARREVTALGRRRRQLIAVGMALFLLVQAEWILDLYSRW